MPYQCEPEVNMNSVGGSHLDFGVNWRGFWFRDKIKYHIWMILIKSNVKNTLKALIFAGQARKSLWIETFLPTSAQRLHLGQARKSLWIETLYIVW